MNLENTINFLKKVKLLKSDSNVLSQTAELTGNVTGNVVGSISGGTVAGTTVIASVGVQSTATSLTATSATVAVAIPANTSHVTAVSANANYALSLPAAVPGTKITIVTPAANGLELWATGSNVKINDVVCSATNEAALAADSHYEATCISATEWILVGYTKLGAVGTAVVPDTR